MTRILLAIGIVAVFMAPPFAELGAKVHLPGDYTSPFGVHPEFSGVTRTGDMYLFANTAPAVGCRWKTSYSVVFC